MDTITYIEPCCCDKQLPQLLREDKLFFQTNGDVTMDKILSSVASLAGDHAVLILTCFDIQRSFLKIVKHYFDRGWIEGFILVTAIPSVVSDGDNAAPVSVEECIRQELSPYLSKVHYAHDGLVQDDQLALMGTGGVVIRGRMLMKAEFGLLLYAGVTSKGRQDPVFDAALSPIVVKARLKPILDASKNEAVSRILERKYIFGV